MTPAQMQELKDFIEARTQAYAVANNNYTRQVLATATKAIVAEVNQVDEETAAKVAAELDKRAAELSDRIIADVALPKEEA